MENMSALILYGKTWAANFLCFVALFFSPQRFWFVYLFWLNVLVYYFFEQADFNIRLINDISLFGYIGIHLTTVLGLLLWAYTVFLAFKNIYKKKWQYALACALHASLVVLLIDYAMIYALAVAYAAAGW